MDLWNNIAFLSEDISQDEEDFLFVWGHDTLSQCVTVF